MTNPKKIPETHFVSVKVEFIYEVFATTKKEAEDKFERSFENIEERAAMLDDCILEIEKIENTHEHLGEAE